MDRKASRLIYLTMEKATQKGFRKLFFFLILFFVQKNAFSQADSVQIALYDSAYSWNMQSFEQSYEGKTKNGTPYQVYAFRYKKLLKTVWFLLLSSPSTNSLTVYGRGKYIYPEDKLPNSYKFALVDVWNTCRLTKKSIAVGDLLLDNFYVIKGKNKKLFKSLLKNNPIQTKKGWKALF